MDNQISDGSKNGTASSNGAHTLTERAAGMGREAADAAKRQADTLLSGAKRGATHAVNETSGAIDAVAGSLADSGQETLSRAAAGLSSRLQEFAGYLEGRSLDQLARDAQGMAQRNPGLLVMGGLALGFALSRFFKASAGRGPAQALSQTD